MKSKKWAALVPVYARLPLVAVACINLAAYYLPKILTDHLTRHDFTLPIDRAIPFVPAFIVVYILAYLQWVVGYILIARDSRELCYRVLSGEIISKLICVAFFLFVPTTMVRGDIASQDFFSALTACIYRLDTPDNLFPSIHCLDSWVCFRGATQMQKLGRWHRCFSLVLTLMVFASTVLVKQHVVVDILAGILVAELGQFLAKKWDAGAIFQKLEAIRRK